MAYKSYKVKIKPTKEQITLLKKSWDGYRLAYNFAVQRQIGFFDDAVKAEHETGKKQPLFISGTSLAKEWTAYKKTLVPETINLDLYSISAKTTEGAIYDCFSACTSFFDHTKGHSSIRPKQKRNAAYSCDDLNEDNKPVRYLYKLSDGTKVYSLYYRTGGPRFKRFSDRICFPVAYQGLEVTDTGVFIAGMFGSDRTHSREDSFFKFGQPQYVPTGTHQDENGTHYINPRISFDGVDWWFSVSTEFAFEKPELNKGKIIAFDAGVAALAVLDDGTAFVSPKDLEEYKVAYVKMQHLRSLLHLKRERIKKLKTKDGTNSASFKKLQKKYYKALNHVNNIKKYHLHKCSKQIVDRLPETIAMEDLSVVDMLKNTPVDPQNKKARGERRQERNQHRDIAASGMATFQNMVSYKAEWRGINIQKVPAPYTSKTCHVCGYINYDLGLDDRDWTCPECGVHHDRDVNAAVNIRNSALEQMKNPKPVKVKKSRPRVVKKKVTVGSV